jgi:hypothetical protein
VVPEVQRTVKRPRNLGAPLADHLVPSDPPDGAIEPIGPTRATTTMGTVDGTDVSLRAPGRTDARSSPVALLALVAALAITGCAAIDRTVDRVLGDWDLVAIRVTGANEARVGEPVALAIEVKLVPLEPATDEKRRAILQDPAVYAWTTEPAAGSTISDEGVFTATAPGSYTVTASAFGERDDVLITVAPSQAGTWAGTLQAMATGKGGRTARYQVPISLSVAPDGSATLSARFDGRTKAGRVYLDATGTGTVDGGGVVEVSGTMSLGPSMAKAKTGDFRLSGAISGGMLLGRVDLMDGSQVDIRLTQE